MKTAIYARISTSDGRQAVENQIMPLRQWSERLGGVVVREFVDEVSGSRSDRASLLHLLESARKREFDVLLIWALDRLTREGIAKLSGYLEKLKSYGVRVMSHQEPWLDTAGPISELMIAIFGWVAQQERSRIQERVRAGLNRARAMGKKLGRPTVSYDSAKIHELRAEGLSVRAIAKVIGVSRSTVSNHL